MIETNGDWLRLVENDWDWLRRFETDWDWWTMIETDWDALRLIESHRDWSRLSETDWDWLRMIENDWEWLRLIEIDWDWLRLPLAHWRGKGANRERNWGPGTKKCRWVRIRSALAEPWALKNWEEKMMNWNQSSKLSSTKKRHFSSNSIDPYCSLIIGNLFRFDLSWTWTQVVVSSSIWSSSLWTWTVQQFFLRCVMMRLSMKSSSSNMSLWDEHK